MLRLETQVECNGIYNTDINYIIKLNTLHLIKFLVHMKVFNIMKNQKNSMIIIHYSLILDSSKVKQIEKT